MSVGHGEKMTVLMLVALVAGFALDFPFRGFSAGSRAERRAFARPEAVSFVVLDAADESRILQRVKGSSRREGIASPVCTDLFFEELPPAAPRPVLSVSGRTRAAALPPVEARLSPFLPSRRAPFPRRIETAERSDESAFSREELLKMN